MSLLARNALVLSTALPMLASPGWCCIGWSQLCSSMLKAGGPIAVRQVAHVQPQPADSSKGLPSCCARRSQLQTANLAATGCLDSIPGAPSAEAAPCRCCEDSRSAAIAPVTKNLVALEAPLFVAWTPMPAIVSAEVRPVDASLQASGPPLRILQCVWRC